MLAKDMSRKEERQTSVARTIPIRQSTAEMTQAPDDWRNQLDLEMKDGCPVAFHQQQEEKVVPAAPLFPKPSYVSVGSSGCRGIPQFYGPLITREERPVPAAPLFASAFGPGGQFSSQPWIPGLNKQKEKASQPGAPACSSVWPGAPVPSTVWSDRGPLARETKVSVSAMGPSDSVIRSS